ncbi:MAG: hypothetical protein A3H45_15510 [Ignavibacteria bacterium RIFCSPLOWO2_02_FULL_55_14]|nr:MAG: hypothetical protein A3H45_15510 [Ignavibacteria bacterium RIFCSPLOWO2_02_FULL_55_14]
MQIAEVEHGRVVQLTALVEGDSSTDFVEAGVNLSPTHPQLARFVEELRALIKRHNLIAESISFALPPDPLFINIIPVDRELVGAKLKTYLEWEMRQYFPDSGPKDFIVGSHIIPSSDGGAGQAFMVGLRRGIVEFVQRAAAELKLKMHLVDVDQFSTEKTVILNYPEILEHEIVLFGLRFGGLDASLIHEGQMTDYRAYALEPSQSPKRSIVEYLRYLKDREIPTPAALILHGIDISPALIKELRDETKIKQTVALNAVRNLPAAKGVYPPFLKDSARFGAAIGLALRAS